MDNRQSNFSWSLLAPFFVALFCWWLPLWADSTPADLPWYMLTMWWAMCAAMSFFGAVFLFIATVPPIAWIYQARIDGKSWAGAVWSVVKWVPIAFVLAVGVTGGYYAINMALQKAYWLSLALGVLVLATIPFTLVSLWKDEAFRSKLNTFDAAKNKRLD